MPVHNSSITYLVRIEAAAEEAERIAAALEAAEHPLLQALSLFESDGGRIEILAHYSDEPSLAALYEVLRKADPIAAVRFIAGLSIEPLSPRDWIAASESQRGPISAGRFYVHGSHDRPRAPRLRGRIEIDAGLAFGTGLHASTQGCLIALDGVLKRRRFRTIVDLGTGTGILAIAAIKGARSYLPPVQASDADPSAVVVARQNARANIVAPRVRIVRAAGFDHPALRQIRADLVLANLTPPLLIRLAPEMAQRLRPGGIAILSGIDAGRSQEVEARFRAMGFILQRRVLIDGWTTLVLSRTAHRRLVQAGPIAPHPD